MSKVLVLQYQDDPKIQLEEEQKINMVCIYLHQKKKALLNNLPFETTFIIRKLKVAL